MLLVDRRAGSKELVKPLRKKGLEVVETELQFGDLAFIGKGEGGADVHIGLEYKRLSDLVSSMRTGRLEGHQLLGMRGAGPDEFPLYDFAYLLVEGDVLYDGRGVLLERKVRRSRTELVPMHGTMNVAEFKKRLHVLHLRGGLNTIYARTFEQSVDELEILYRVWTDKALDEHSSHLAIYNAPPLLPISQCRKTLSSLPGLGFARSAGAQRAFGSVRNAICASVADWANVDMDGRRLGEAAAVKIVQAINEVAT